MSVISTLSNFLMYTLQNTRENYIIYTSIFTTVAQVILRLNTRTRQFKDTRTIKINCELTRQVHR
jgi:hypothetical protein